MRAALYEGVEPQLSFVDDIEIEEPRPGEVMVRVANCGICHSDLTMIDMMVGSGAKAVLGHEAAGTVEQIGPGVTSVVPGDKVLLTPLAPCGSCYFCSRGEPTACELAQAFSSGFRPDGTSPFSRAEAPVMRGLGVGGFGEFTVVRESGVVKLAPDTPLDVACVVGCAIQTGVGAVVNTAKVEPGATVLVTGLGGIGISVVQGARLAGAAQIIVSDPVAERRESALHFGATSTLDPMNDDVVAKTKELTNNIGVDYAFEAAGVDALIETCVEASRVRGTTVVVGVDATFAGSPVRGAALATYGKRIVGSLLGDCHPQRDIPMFMELWRRGRLDLEAMVSNRFDIADANEGLAALRAAKGIRTVLTVGS